MLREGALAEAIQKRGAHLFGSMRRGLGGRAVRSVRDREECLHPISRTKVGDVG